MYALRVIFSGIGLIASAILLRILCMIPVFAIAAGLWLECKAAVGDEPLWLQVPGMHVHIPQAR